MGFVEVFLTMNTVYFVDKNQKFWKISIKGRAVGKIQTALQIQFVVSVQRAEHSEKRFKALFW